MSDLLIEILAARFKENMQRHIGLIWDDVSARLKLAPGKRESLSLMEASGGEPDVIGRDEASGEFIFCDCSAESPSGRRSLCYDNMALESRKENKPATSALQMAADMAIELLDEDQYRALQKFGEFDKKSSSWILTPPKIRNLGGALFCDRRYETVFTYHNGAESYYAVRGFRGILKV